MAGVVVRNVTNEGPVYSLTPAGLELFPLIQGLGYGGSAGHAATTDLTTSILDCCSGMFAAFCLPERLGNAASSFR